MTTKGKVTRLFLGLLEAGSLITAETLVSTLMRLTPVLNRQKPRYFIDRRYYLRSAIRRLAERGLVRLYRASTGRSYFKITKSGRQQLLRYQLGEISVKRPKHWDGKWHVIIFDIKEYRRAARNHLRHQLVHFGFKKLQNSVWAFPYECEELILLLKAHLHFGRDVLYLKVEKLENDRWLREFFALK